MTPSQQAFLDLTDILAEIAPALDTSTKLRLVRRVEAFKAAINPVLREHLAMLDAREAYLAGNGVAPAADEMARLCHRMSQDVVDVKPGADRDAFRALMQSSKHVIDACRSMVGEKILQRAKVVSTLNKIGESDNEAIDSLTAWRVLVNKELHEEGLVRTDAPNAAGGRTVSVMSLINAILNPIGLGEVEIVRDFNADKITFVAKVTA